ncbi:MAG: hypothetical protein QXR63_00735 [Candidatus Bathyarchaeia archaeon]
MSLKEDIFNEFIKKLEVAQLPTKLIDKLKELWENGKLDSKDEIRIILKEACENAQNKGN